MDMDGQDDDWVQRARAGDQAAYGRLVQTHSGRLFQVCYRITGDETLADEAVQEAWISAWKKLEGFDGRSRFTTWLHRVAVNAALDQLRRNKRHLHNRGGAEELDAIAGAAAGPEQSAWGGQVGARIDEALAELSGMERDAFLLRHHAGEPFERIAAVLDAPPGACRHAVFRAVKKLREVLHEENEHLSEVGT
jgi:RNA polymerase sigma-70 factor (ECF subfamily)